MRTAITFLACALLAMPALAGSQPNGVVRVIGDGPRVIVSNGTTFVATGTGMRRNYREFGIRRGNAAESATAKRGPYDWGQCPEGSLLTTFGTCATRR